MVDFAWSSVARSIGVSRYTCIIYPTIPTCAAPLVVGDAIGMLPRYPRELLAYRTTLFAWWHVHAYRWNYDLYRPNHVYHYVAHS